MCIDLTAVDYLEHPSGSSERFEVVVNLLDIQQRRRLRLRVPVPAEDPTMPTLFDLYPGTEALEREVFDMFGIEFTDHPDLTRILMPEDWIGHPLRKDYEIGRIPVQFKGANA
jgi:NADH-quinone oxidoreductase subunit C